MIQASERHTKKISHIIYASSLMDKIFGMIFTRNAGGLIFNTRFGIHTFFMSKPIDVVILDNLSRVVTIKKSLKPNRVFIWNPKFSVVVELPEGSIKNTKIEIGTKIEIN